jgi:hypothetical protein
MFSLSWRGTKVSIGDKRTGLRLRMKGKARVQLLWNQDLQSSLENEECVPGKVMAGGMVWEDLRHFSQGN